MRGLAVGVASLCGRTCVSWRYVLTCLLTTGSGRAPFFVLAADAAPAPSAVQVLLLPGVSHPAGAGVSHASLQAAPATDLWAVLGCEPRRGGPSAAHRPPGVAFCVFCLGRWAWLHSFGAAVVAWLLMRFGPASSRCGPRSVALARSFPSRSHNLVFVLLMVEDEAERQDAHSLRICRATCPARTCGAFTSTTWAGIWTSPALR